MPGRQTESAKQTDRQTDNKRQKETETDGRRRVKTMRKMSIHNKHT